MSIPVKSVYAFILISAALTEQLNEFLQKQRTAKRLKAENIVSRRACEAIIKDRSCRVASPESSKGGFNLQNMLTVFKKKSPPKKG